MAEGLQKPRCSKLAPEDINTRSRLLESLINTLWNRVLHKPISAKAKDYRIPYIGLDSCHECDEEVNSKSVKNAFDQSEGTIFSEQTLNSYASINHPNFLITKDVCQKDSDISYNHASDSLDSLTIGLNSTSNCSTEKSAIRTLPKIDVVIKEGHELQYNDSTTLNMNSGVIPMENVSVQVDHAQLRLLSLTPTKKISESTQNPINAFVCKICDKRLLTRKSLNQHKNTVHKDPKLWQQCPFCEYKTPRKSTFGFHIAVCKANNQPRVHSFVCEVCSKTFVLKRHLTFHKKTHADGNRSQI